MRHGAVDGGNPLLPPLNDDMLLSPPGGTGETGVRVVVLLTSPDPRE